MLIIRRAFLQSSFTPASTSLRASALRSCNGSRSGGALIAAVLVVTAVATLGACLLQVSSVMTRRQVQGIDNKRAFYLAESGLGEAMYGLRIGRTGNVGTPELPAGFGNGLFWVEAEELDATHVRLVSTGLCGGGRFSLALVVQKGTPAVAALGIFGEEDLVVNPGSLIDSYDTRLDPAPAPVGGGLKKLGGIGPGSAPADGSGNARVGCNGDIRVVGAPLHATKIDGDVTPGTCGTVTVGSNVTITGSTAPRSAPITLPDIDVPEFTSLGDLTHSRRIARVLTGSDLRYDAIHVTAGAKVVLRGPLTLVANSLTLDNTAALEVDSTNGPVRVFLTDALQLATGSVLSSVNHVPEQVSFLVAGAEMLDRNADGIPDPPVRFDCSGRLDGTIYAPESAVTLRGGFELFGALSAKSIALDNDAKIHFDQALLSTLSSSAGAPKPLAWSVVDLPDVPLVSLRVDPLVVLGLQAAQIPKSSLAHLSVPLDVEYVDALGFTQTFTGMEGDFDWSQVQHVIQVVR